jgi:hypothetical protein
MPLYTEIVSSHWFEKMKEDFDRNSVAMINNFPFVEKQTVEQKLDLILEELQSLRETIERSTIMLEFNRLTKEFDQTLKRTTKSKKQVRTKEKQETWIGFTK